jgi:hypothetical protein
VYLKEPLPPYPYYQDNEISRRIYRHWAVFVSCIAVSRRLQFAFRTLFTIKKPPPHIIAIYPQNTYHVYHHPSHQGHLNSHLTTAHIWREHFGFTLLFLAHRLLHRPHIRLVISEGVRVSTGRMMGGYLFLQIIAVFVFMYVCVWTWIWGGRGLAFVYNFKGMGGLRGDMRA